MRIGPKPHGRLRMLVRLNSKTYTVQRPIEDVTRFGERDITYEQHTIDARLFAPDELNIEDEFGERLRGDLNGVSLGEVDVRSDDEFTVGVETYKVDDVERYPPDDDPVYTIFALSKMVNP